MTKRHKLYLNDYGTASNRLRIESTRGGERQHWVAKTTLNSMKQAKAYLERVRGK